MAIEKALSELPYRPDEEELEEEVSIEIVNPDAISMETEDGGMIIDFEGGENASEMIDFDGNLAEGMDDSLLGRLSSDLTGDYHGDKTSRKDWEEAYTKGLNQLGLKHEERSSPWQGACGVTHPILSEAVVRFQSQAIGEIFPAGGPVRTRIVGQMTTEKTEQAHRLQDYMNYLLQERMREYRPEMEKLLFSLPLAGSAFKKVYWDPNMNRPCAMFVPAEDFVVSYGASSLETCERATHVMRRTKNEIRKLQVSGFYRDIELGHGTPDTSEIQSKYDELTGDSPSYESDTRLTILEMHVYLDLEGYEDKDGGEPTGVGLPYVVTIAESSNKVLSIRRNWFEDDEKKMPRQHFVHYEYIPGLGFYGFGLIHLIGGIAKSATSILRQLVDAGTLSNLPGGLKSRGLRIRGDDTPISPGEFRDVDVPGGAIKDSITFLPYKEPSGTLFQLLGNIVEEGRRFASLTDMNIGDMKQEAPVGTTLALIERSMKVMSAIQARLHASMKREFEILADIVGDHCPHEYPYDIGGNEEMKSEDFDDRIDVIPVSDPNAATMAQRIMQYQAALQLAGTAPQMYDLPQLHRQMLEVLGIKDPDRVVPLEDDIPPKDPVSENMDILRGDPVKAFMWQDHEAHITSHMAAAEDPKMQEMLQQTGPMAVAIQAAGAAHIVDHMAFQYRHEIEQEMGVELPPPDEPLPEDVEVRLSKLIAQASQRVLQKDQAEAAQQQADEQAQDPIIQMRQKELEIQAQDVQSKVQERQARIQLEGIKAKDRGQLERDKLDSQEKLAEAKIGSDLAREIIEQKAKAGELETQEAIEAARLGVKIMEDLIERERIQSDERREDARLSTDLIQGSRNRGE